MSIDRRQFLKIAGISAAVGGLGGTAAFNFVSKNWLEAADALPGPNALTGKRWGMAVDIRRFQAEPGLAATCIAACHKIHNVPSIPTNQDVKWIWTEHYENAFPDDMNQNMQEGLEQIPILVFCNHCDNPPCVRVCPTQATYKRPDGIVMMDMHRCIGCRFCMAACPFGARSFNFQDPRPFLKEENIKFPTRMKGVVEKCTLCYERLAEGLKPACVEASTGAILFGDLADEGSEVRQALRERYSIRRKPNLGTQPSLYYLI
jgi:molybdopterin-containing oxidoreductase family iron-sulfur binding subunit